jgi:hypothetical protein
MNSFSAWDFAAFLANSVVFLLIGVAVEAMPLRSYRAVLLTAPDGVSAQSSLSALPLDDLASRTAYPLVGRVTRRSCACSGALHAAHTAAARRNRGRNFWCRRLFHCGAGLDYAAVPSAAGLFADGDPSEKLYVGRSERWVSAVLPKRIATRRKMGFVESSEPIVNLATAGRTRGFGALSDAPHSIAGRPVR